MATKLLDCTLRDGGYLFSKNYKKDNIDSIISSLIKSKIDIIEVGFLQNKTDETGSVIYNNIEAINKVIPDNKNNVMFVVLSDYSRVDLSLISKKDNNKLDGIRFCFLKNEWKQALSVAYIIKEKGYKLFLQPVDILSYKVDELMALLDEVNKIKPYEFSIVNSFGGMYLEDLESIYNIVDSKLSNDIVLGFHSHNNFQLANALSQRFFNLSIGKRETIIDCTLGGIGRGCGNTPTELIAGYLNAKHGYSYQISVILDVLYNLICKLDLPSNSSYSPLYFIGGIHDAHPNNLTYLANKKDISFNDIDKILSNIGNKKKRYDYDLLDEELTKIK